MRIETPNGVRRTLGSAELLGEHTMARDSQIHTQRARLPPPARPQPQCKSNSFGTGCTHALVLILVRRPAPGGHAAEHACGRTGAQPIACVGASMT